MLALIGGFRGIITAIGAAAAMWAAMAAYDRLIDDPAVASAAREAYVHRSELVAAEAKLAKAERERIAGEKLLEEYRKGLDAYRAAKAAEDVRQNQRIADYETQLIALGKSCLVDADFLDWLREFTGQAPGQSGGGTGQGGGGNKPAGTAGRLPHP